MNDQQLYQRQQQIYRLHKKIKQYKLTPEQSLLLQRNQQQQQLLIESKFISSKINKAYKFPKPTDDDDYSIVGYKDICNLNELNGGYDRIRKQQANSMREAESRRLCKSPQMRYATEYETNIIKMERKNDVPRESYSPRGMIGKIVSENRFKDGVINYNYSKKKEGKLNHYLSTSNDKSCQDKSYHTLRMITDSYDVKSNKNKDQEKFKDKFKDKEQSLCQSIKSVIRVKNSMMGGNKKESIKDNSSISRQYESSKIQSTKLNKTYKNTISKQGKQNQNRPRYGNNKKPTYNNYTNPTKYTQHDKSLKQWNRSYYNPNTSKDTYAPPPSTYNNKSINGLYSSLNHKQSVFSNTHKWLNTTDNQDYKSIQKYPITKDNKKPIKKKQSLYCNTITSKNKYTISSSSNLGYNNNNTSGNYKSFKSSLNNTNNLKSKLNESKNDMYFSKVFQSLRSKNGNRDSMGSEAMYSSCSRIPFSSPLSYKYLEYKQGITLTNR